ncbi:B12-binding domain-containing radical SAM protein [Patescibacteria group bacterium]|nr:B12-binding domain-containing radical SAM protein [Patescibacteria group bacterium]
MPLKILLFNGPKIHERADKLEMENRILRLGIASLAGYLLENEVEVIVADPVTQSTPEINKLLETFQPDLVGLHAYTSEIHAAAETAQWIKSISAPVKIIIGGPHASAIPERTLEEFPIFDFVAAGEGEQTLLELVQEQNLRSIRGLTYRNDYEIKSNAPREPIANIDTLPLPPWEMFNLDKYRGADLMGGFGRKSSLLELPVEGARGCPFGCIFCYRTLGKKIRFKSASRIVDEVERNVNKFGANKIHFIEGTFAVNKAIAREMCLELIKRNLHKKMTWSTGGRVDILDEKLLELMKKSGCKYIGIGVESGDQAMLNRIGKGINIEQIKQTFAICKKVGITTEAEFILGHPFETKETIQKTINLSCSLPTKYATFAILVPFPGTQIAEMAKENIGGLKILTHNWRVYGKQIGNSLELKQLPHEKLLEYQALAYRKFYLRPSHIKALVSRLNKERIWYGVKNILGIR